MVAARSGTALWIQGEPAHAERFYLAAGARKIGSQESWSVPGGSWLPLFEIVIRPPTEQSTIRTSSL
jgi:hypothetical protein